MADAEKEVLGLKIQLVHLASLAAELDASNDLLILSPLIQVALTRRLSTFSTPDKPSKYWRPLSVYCRPKRVSLSLQELLLSLDPFNFASYE